jgi:arsenate reductase (glutaredoxin)
MRVTVIGIPNCGTVKKALAELRERGANVEFVNFREQALSSDRVARWVARFGNRALRNVAGGSYRALGSEREDWSDDAWTAAFVSDPMLLKRPIVERDGAPILVGWNHSAAEIAAALA